MRRLMPCWLLLLCLLTPAGAAAQTANTLSVRGAPSGGIPALAATGVDANISINLVPKGTGVVLFGGVAGITGGGAAGFVPLFTAPTVVGNSLLFQNTPAGNVLVTNSGIVPADMAAFLATLPRTNEAFVHRSLFVMRIPGQPFLNLFRGNGTYAAPTKVLTGDAIGNLSWSGYGGAVKLLVNGPKIQVTALTDLDVATPFFRMDIGAGGAGGLDTIGIGVNAAIPTDLRFTNNLATWDSAEVMAWSTDLFLSRQAAATLQQGGPDAAAPVAQASGVQNVLAGTLDTAGTGRLLLGSRGTGTGVGGNIGVQVAYPGLTGTAQNPLTTVVTALATNSSTNALQDLVSVTPIVNQSGTASYNGFTVDVTRTAVGSGVGQMLALKVGGVQRFGVTDGATGVGTHVRAAQATPPTCSANCGTTVPAVVGTDFSMLVTMGSGGVPTSPFTVTFNGTYTTPPSCQVVANVTTTGFVTKVAPTATTVVVTTATNPAVNDSYNLVCTGVV